VSAWKVILATLVIFSAGVLTGLVVQHRTDERRQTRFVPPPPPIITRGFLDRMQGELQLAPEQRDHLEKIITESQERVRILWSLVGPEMAEERRHVNEEIRGQLRPDQREKFEQLLKRKPLPPRGGHGFRRSTNDVGAKPDHSLTNRP
jgi:hypothetical protein